MSVVDGELNPIGESMWRQERIYPEHLTTFDEGGALEFVTGCTMLFNKQAKDVVVFPADKAVMHDIWIALCVLRSGGIVSAIYEPLVYYRQHGNNVLGVNNWSQYSRLRRLLNMWKSITANYKHYLMLKALGYGSFFKYLHYKRWRTRIFPWQAPVTAIATLAKGNIALCITQKSCIPCKRRKAGLTRHVAQT